MDENQALGALCKAMSVCPVHRRYLLADINTMLIPPIRLKQFFFFEGNRQYGAVTWAFLNEAAAEKHVQNQVPLTLPEWQSGDQLWIISLIGHRIRPARLVSKIAEKLPHKSAKYIRRDNRMHVKKIVTLTKKNGRLIPSVKPLAAQSQH